MAGTYPSGAADKWDKGANPLDGAKPCKGVGPSKGSGLCGGDPSDDDDEYCEGGVVSPGSVPRRLPDTVVTPSAATATSLPVSCTSRGTTGTVHVVENKKDKKGFSNCLILMHL
jgi:hypothetical protein